MEKVVEFRLYLFFFFIFFFWPGCMACGILVPDQGSNPRPLLWKHRILTTGPPGKSWFWLYLECTLYFEQKIFVDSTWGVRRRKKSRKTKIFGTNDWKNGVAILRGGDAKSRAGLVAGWLQLWTWWVWNVYYTLKHIELAVSNVSLKYRRGVWTGDTYFGVISI